MLALWEGVVRAAGIPPYILPGPILVAKTLVDRLGHAGALAAGHAARSPLAALAAAVVVGGLLAVLFSLSRWIELSLFPYAIILQVTPIVAIAPLIIIWANNVELSLLICAWLVAFFPILSNTILGLRSVDPNLLDLFQLYGAGRWRTLVDLRLPVGAALFPGRPAHLRRPGADRRRRRGVRRRHRRQRARASPTASSNPATSSRSRACSRRSLLISATGIVIFLLLTLLSHLLLRRWHESALTPEN